MGGFFFFFVSSLLVCDLFRPRREVYMYSPFPRRIPRMAAQRAGRRAQGELALCRPARFAARKRIVNSPLVMTYIGRIRVTIKKKKKSMAAQCKHPPALHPGLSCKRIQTHQGNHKGKRTKEKKRPSGLYSSSANAVNGRVGRNGQCSSPASLSSSAPSSPTSASLSSSRSPISLSSPSDASLSTLSMVGWWWWSIDRWVERVTTMPKFIAARYRSAAADSWTAGRQAPDEILVEKQKTDVRIS